MRAAVNPLTGTRRRATVPGGDCGRASDEAAHHHCGLRCRALPPGHTCRIGKKHGPGGLVRPPFRAKPEWPHRRQQPGREVASWLTAYPFLRKPIGEPVGMGTAWDG